MPGYRLLTKSQRLHHPQSQGRLHRPGRLQCFHSAVGDPRLSTALSVEKRAAALRITGGSQQDAIPDTLRKETKD